MKLNPPVRPCDRNRLEAFLTGDLSDDQQREVVLHLNNCQECRGTLTRQAAEPEAWMEAQALLRPGPFDSRLLHGAAEPVHGRPLQPLAIQTVLAALGPTDDPQMLGRLGGYEVCGVIGAGGMGVVLKAIDKSLNRTVAIKVLAPHLACSGAARKRFAREAQAAAAVLHPNVVAIHSVSNDEALPYLVMPYIRGQSLQKRLDEEGPLALREILRIGAQIAAGLAAAHAQGLVHRDINPANVLLEEKVERVAITDFGLARAIDDATITRSGMIAGTPQYMSPEQARGEAVDQRSDLFSLGSVLYALCTGRPPFRAETSYGVMRRITDDEPTPIRDINPDIPQWLCAIIGRLMAKSAADRFQSAAEVAELLESCLAHVQQPSAVPLPEQLRLAASSQGSRWGRWSRRKLVLCAAFALALLLAGVVIVLELNKGTLTIECEADDVSLRITQGDAVVEKLTVTRAGKSLRVAAGTYVVEIDGGAAGFAIENGTVTLRRGKREIVRIVRSREAVAAPQAPEVPASAKSDPTPNALDPMPLHGGNSPAGELRFSEAKEIVLAAGSMKFMLDFDSGQTMDMPATRGRPEERLMDVLTDQMQPYHYPKELIGRGLYGVEVKAGDWDASATEVRRALTGDRLGPLKQMDLGPEKHPTYFFRTRDGAWGILQLLEVVDEPKGIRLRYKTVEQVESAGAPPAAGGEAPRIEGAVTDVHKQEFAEISLGADDGLQVRDTLDVYRGKTYLGRLTVVRVAADASVARIESRTGEIRRGDRVSALRRPATAPGGSAKIQLLLASPQGAAVIWKPSASENSADPELKLPVRFSAAPGETIPFFLVQIPDREALELSGSLEIAPLGKSVAPFVTHNAITVEITAEDVDGAASGNHVVKVIYLPHAEHAEIPVAGVETLGTERLDPGVDPIAEAKRRGHLLAVLRLGNRVRQPPEETRPQTETALPKRLRQFATSDQVAIIAVSADGRRIAVANGNPTRILQTGGTSRVKDNWRPVAEIFDAESGKAIASLKLSSDEEDAAIAATPRVSHLEVTALAFSPDGSLVAVGTSIGQIKLFDAQTGKLLRSLDDEQPRLADQATPMSWKPLQRAMGSVRSLAFSPDGSSLAVCGESFADYADIFDGVERLGRKATGPGRLKLWDVKTGELKQDLAGHSHAYAVAFSSDGEMLASAGRWSDERDDGTGVILWNPQTGEKLRTIAVEANGGAHAVAFSPTKRLLVIGSRNFDKENDASATTITAVYPASGLREWQRNIPGNASPKAFTADGKTIAVLCGGESIQFLDAATGQLQHEIKAADTPTAREWNALAVARQANVLVVGGSDAEKRGSVAVWSLAGVPLDAKEGADDAVLAPNENVHHLVWGKEADGLQAGTGFFGSERRVYRRGEIVPIAVKLRNVSRQAIPIAYSEARLRHARPDIRNADGQRLRVQMPPAVRYVYPTVEKTLEPGEEIVFDRIDLRLSADAPLPVKTPGVDAAPGDYKVSYMVPLIKPVHLTTAELKFEVQEGEDSSEEVDAD